MSFEAEPHGGLTDKQVEVAEQRMAIAEEKFKGFSSDPKAQTEAYKSYVDFYGGFIENKGYQIDMKALQDNMNIFKNVDSLDLEHKGLGEKGGKTMRGWAKDIVEFMGFVGDEPKVQAQRNLLINKLLEEISAKGVNVHHKIPSLENYSLSFNPKKRSMEVAFFGADGNPVIEAIDLKDMVNSLDDKLLLNKVEEEKVIKEVDVLFELAEGKGKAPVQIIVDGIVYNSPIESGIAEWGGDDAGDFLVFTNIDGDNEDYKFYVPKDLDATHSAFKAEKLLRD